jgi:shikimate kinase
MAPRLVLIGPPGAGKTTVGQLVAAALGEPFTDADLVVERRAGRAIPDIFLDDGEAAFRDLERAACADLLGEDPSVPSGVLSLGGGAVLDPRTEADLIGLRTVFLDVTIADAAGRIGFAQSRPLLTINPRARWTQLMNDRRPVYQRVAGARVDTAGRTPEDVAAAVLDALGSLEAG